MRHTARHLAEIQPRRSRATAPAEVPAIVILLVLVLVIGSPFIADLFLWLFKK